MLLVFIALSSGFGFAYFVLRKSIFCIVFRVTSAFSDAIVDLWDKKKIGNAELITEHPALVKHDLIFCLGIIIVAVTLNPGESPSYHNYLTNQSSYDSDMDHTPIVRSRRKISTDYDCDDSGGEYGPGDMNADGNMENFKWDAEAQVGRVRRSIILI